MVLSHVSPEESRALTSPCGRVRLTGILRFGLMINLQVSQLFRVGMVGIGNCALVSHFKRELCACRDSSSCGTCW